MPMPSFRPTSTINTVREAFRHRELWPKATIDPEAHYQKLAAAFRYVHETSGGYVLSDLGLREIRAAEIYTANLCRVGGDGEVIPYEQTSFPAQDDAAAIRAAFEWIKSAPPEQLDPQTWLVVKHGARAIHSEALSSSA